LRYWRLVRARIWSIAGFTVGSQANDVGPSNDVTTEIAPAPLTPLPLVAPTPEEAVPPAPAPPAPLLPPAGAPKPEEADSPIVPALQPAAAAMATPTPKKAPTPHRRACAESASIAVAIISWRGFTAILQSQLGRCSDLVRYYTNLEPLSPPFVFHVDRAASSRGAGLRPPVPGPVSPKLLATVFRALPMLTGRGRTRSTPAN
jgi:hypothetical protein